MRRVDVNPFGIRKKENNCCALALCLPGRGYDEEMRRRQTNEIRIGDGGLRRSRWSFQRRLLHVVRS